MNWKRGLHRIFFVLAALWCLWAQNWVIRDHGERVILNAKLARDAVEFDKKYALPAKLHADEANLAQTEAVLKMNGWKHIFTTPPELGFLFLVLFAPPILTYVLLASGYFVLRWILRGFRAAT